VWALWRRGERDGKNAVTRGQLPASQIESDTLLASHAE
jgi:hypothetical protein